MPVPNLTTIATAAKATLDAAAVVVDGNVLKVYAFDPGWPDSLPAVAIRFDSFQRRGVDDGEPEIGSRTWDLLYRVQILTPLDGADARSQDGMRTVLAAVLDAFDRDPSLGGLVDDAVLTSGEQSFTDDETLSRQLIVMDCDLLIQVRST